MPYEHIQLGRFVGYGTHRCNRTVSAAVSLAMPMRARGAASFPSVRLPAGLACLCVPVVRDQVWVCCHVRVGMLLTLRHGAAAAGPCTARALERAAGQRGAGSFSCPW